MTHLSTAFWGVIQCNPESIPRDWRGWSPAYGSSINGPKTERDRRISRHSRQMSGVAGCRLGAVPAAIAANASKLARPLAATGPTW